MKTKLLKRLRKEYRVIYFPETFQTREYWEIQQSVDFGYECIETAFRLDEAISDYNMRTRNHISKYIGNARKKQILP